MMYSDSGVVTSTCGGLRSIRGPIGRRRITGPRRGPDRGERQSVRLAECEKLRKRRFEILADVVRERFSGETYTTSVRSGSGPASARRTSPSRRRGKRGQRFSRSGRRRDQHVGAGADDRPAAELRLGRLAVSGRKPVRDKGVQKVHCRL